MLFLSTAAAIITVIIETPITMILTFDRWRDDIEIFPLWLAFIALANIITNVVLNTSLALIGQSITHVASSDSTTFIFLAFFEIGVCLAEAFAYSRFWKTKLYEFIACSLFANIISFSLGLILF